MAKLTLNGLVSKVAKKEGNKISMDGGNIKEVFKCLAEVLVEEGDDGREVWGKYLASTYNRLKKKAIKEGKLVEEKVTKSKKKVKNALRK